MKKDKESGGYKRLKRRANITLILIIILAIIACRWDIAVRTYTVDTGKNAEFTKILLITDFHSSYYGAGGSELISQIDKISPEIVLLGGDICDDKVPHERTWALLENIGSRYPCYYVTGNHEYWSGEAGDIKEKIRLYGVDVLVNEKRNIEINGKKITLYGLEDPEYFGTYGINEHWAEALETLNADVDKTALNILLTHRPDGADYYKNSSFDISLCGHAHGGQVRIPYILNGLYAPNQGLFPDYAGGEYDFPSHKMIVSRGLCRNTMPRVFNRPELVVVEAR